MLHLVGHSERKIFGWKPAERLRRQMAGEDAVLVVDADAVLDDAAVRWLIENPGHVLASDSGRPLAVVVEGEANDGALTDEHLPVETPASIGERYIRKLRRKSTLLVLSLEETPQRNAERALFDKVYKGVTDLVTKVVWPVPAFVVTRVAARLGIHPNAITAVGFVLMLVASWLFFIGEIGGGLMAALAMTFFDTVDGKLARVTVTSSRLGNWLDHGTDVIHPPLWWICLAHGLTVNDPASTDAIVAACIVILACYVIGRIVEVSFHLLFGFNAFLYRPLDSAFRMIVARRNILLLIMLGGFAAGRETEAFIACAAWSLVSTAIQLLRIATAWLQSRKVKLEPWIA